MMDEMGDTTLSGKAETGSCGDESVPYSAAASDPKLYPNRQPASNVDPCEGQSSKETILKLQNLHKTLWDTFIKNSKKVPRK
jgi:hypothetical protein